jgi:voltage-gated potassium channel
MPLTAARALAEITPYQLFMLVISLFALLLVGLESLLVLDPATSVILQHADNLVCALFLIDFGNTLARAPNRLRYLATWGWIDLLSSIPAIDAFRYARAARVLRVLRLLRAIRSVRVLGQFIMSRRGESLGLAAGLATLLLVTFASIAILQFEMPGGGNIQTGEDAVWWSISTLTTVGYGDRYPTTSEGRLIAVMLMASGVGLLSVLSGLVAGWFLAPAAKGTDEDLRELKEMVMQLQQRLEVPHRRD